MIDLGTAARPETLDRVVLTVDEMDVVLERLGLDELPVVLDQFPRHDSPSDRAAAFSAATAALDERGLLADETVDEGLACLVRVLGRPSWVVAMRLFTENAVSRLCLAHGEDLTVLAMRGPDSYVLTAQDHGHGAVVVAALGDAQPLPFAGFSAPTEALAQVFDDAADTAAAVRRIGEIASPAREAHVVAEAMVHCYAHTEIVALEYENGNRSQADTNVAVFDTRNGRFVATSRSAGDGTKWSALSSGTDARIRQVVDDLVATLTP